MTTLREATIRLAHVKPELRDLILPLLASYEGNADGQPIYPVEIDHGYGQPLSGGHDIMKRLVDQYRIEQGSQPMRDKNPRL